jgi:hypothetical protein
MATRLDQLRALQQKLPVANQQLANQYKAAQDIQMQQAVGQIGQGGLAKPKVAQLGAAQVGGAAEKQLKGQAQAAEQTAQVQKLGMSEAASQAQQRLSGKALSLEDKQRRLDKQLSQLTSDKRSELFDKQMKFSYTQSGDKYFNERQMSDWVRLKANNEQEFRNYQAQMARLYERQTKMLEVSYNRLAQTLKSDAAMAQLEAKGTSRVELERAKVALEQKLAKQKANAANKNAMWSAGGAIVGGVVGTMVAPGVGTAAGASVGSGLGSTVGSQV